MVPRGGGPPAVAAAWLGHTEQQASSLELWGHVEREVQNLTSCRKRGVRLSEDFAVDRVCAALAKLRQQHGESLRNGFASGHDGARQGATNARVEELVSLRVDLASDEQRLRNQQAKIDEVRQQIQQARQARADLEQELEREREGRRRASEGHAREWKETAYRTQVCQSRLSAMEQEVVQLQLAVGRPESLGAVWENLVKRLDAELSSAQVEAAEQKRECEQCSAEVLAAERELERMRRPSDAGGLAGSVASMFPFAATGIAAVTVSDEQRGDRSSRDHDAARAEVARIASRSSEVNAPRKLASLGLTQASTRASSMSRPTLTPVASAKGIGIISSPSQGSPPAEAPRPLLGATPAAAVLQAASARSGGTAHFRQPSPQFAPVHVVNYAGSPPPEGRGSDVPRVLDEARVVLEKLESLKSQHHFGSAMARSAHC